MDMKVCLILALLFTENYCQKDALGLHANDNVSKIRPGLHSKHKKCLIQKSENVSLKCLKNQKCLTQNVSKIKKCLTQNVSKI